ncbi:DUF3093 domain-containing protein [Sinomonas sp. JGH33]|uniref:DUF3093 domain-containing protein n=1 Tax=Sinomonas terricola TaxID=3110330 RepID=A0ABU5T435_9MICC|nr:DUF3093 domain-containing protein [Sinomonas sp. JGH33]MEA5454274.1 DUF3093 domain-containing protein [Sinomonas sp. JGH33]
MSDSPSAAPLPRESAGAVFTEKLWPAWWVWVVVLGIAGACVLVLAPISVSAGFTGAAIVFLVLCGILVATTPAVVVTPREFRAGRAVLPREFVASAEGFTGDEATAERGTRLDGRAYLCLRGWISPVVRVELDDPDDPTPYWLISTRRPAQLVAALAASRA